MELLNTILVCLTIYVVIGIGVLIIMYIRDFEGFRTECFGSSAEILGPVETVLWLTLFAFIWPLFVLIRLAR